MAHLVSSSAASFRQRSRSPRRAQATRRPSSAALEPSGQPGRVTTGDNGGRALCRGVPPLVEDSQTLGPSSTSRAELAQAVRTGQVGTLRSGDVIGRDWSLQFEATANVPMGAQYYWQVVNTGREASDAKNLR